MFSSRRRILLQAAKLFDSAVMVFAFGLGTLLVAAKAPEVSLTQLLSMRMKVQSFVLFGCFLFPWYAIFSAFGLYNSKRLSTRSAELRDILKASSAASAALLMAALAFHIGVAPDQCLFHGPARLAWST